VQPLRPNDPALAGGTYNPTEMELTMKRNTPCTTANTISTETPSTDRSVCFDLKAFNDLTDELGRVSASLVAINMATEALPLEQHGAIQQVSMDALHRLERALSALKEKKASIAPWPSQMSSTELLEANRTALAARQLFNLQATRYRFSGAAGGEQVRAWACQQVLRLDEEIFTIIMEMDSRNLSGDEDAKAERDIAVAEANDLLPYDAPFKISVTRKGAA
jgi:hypothetical protein